MIIKKFEAFSNQPVTGELQHQQVDSDLPRSPQVSFNEIDDDDDSLLNMSDLENGDIIIFQGSRYQVIDKGDFAVKVKSLSTNKETFLNKRQISQYGISLVK
jgi:hypothetical protein